MIAIYLTGTSNERKWAHSAGKAIGGRKHVAAADGKKNNFRNHEAGDPFERKTVGEGPTVFFDGTDRAFDDVDVIVCSHRIETNRQDIGFDAFKFSVRSEHCDDETPCGVKALDVAELLQKSRLRSVGELSSRTKLQFRRYGVKEGYTLNEEIVDTKCDFTMMFKDGWWKWCWHECSCWGTSPFNCFALERSDIWTVNREISFDVGNVDRTVLELIRGNGGLKNLLCRTTEGTMKLTSSFC